MNHILKISSISLVLPTHENADIFNTFDEIYICYSSHKSEYPLFIMQHNATCQYRFLEMHSLPMADELRSFQFLDINEIQ